MLVTKQSKVSDAITRSGKIEARTITNDVALDVQHVAVLEVLQSSVRGKYHASAPLVLFIQTAVSNLPARTWDMNLLQRSDEPLVVLTVAIGRIIRCGHRLRCRRRFGNDSRGFDLLHRGSRCRLFLDNRNGGFAAIGCNTTPYSYSCIASDRVATG